MGDTIEMQRPVARVVSRQTAKGLLTVDVVPTAAESTLRVCLDGQELAGMSGPVAFSAPRATPSGLVYTHYVATNPQTVYGLTADETAALQNAKRMQYAASPAAQRSRASRGYDALQNEGGEGYNPNRAS